MSSELVAIQTSIWPMVSEIISENGLQGCRYAEPYAGGCGLALSLLFRGFVDELVLNDIDRSIWCFWNAVLNNKDQLIDLIESTDVTIEEWQKQKEIQRNRDSHSDIEVAFSTFFLNRTNRSGIIQGGVIGGQAQNGNYLIDCRYNIETAATKINKIHAHRDQISFDNLDAIKFISKTKRKMKKGIYCIDPPYYAKGQTLYTNFYGHDDHLELSSLVQELSSNWIVTYDDADQIRDMYRDEARYNFSLNYSAATKRIGTELLVASSGLVIPEHLSKIS